jgi:MFS family permease
MAIQMQSVALGWQIYEITHDALSLGIIGLAEALPYMSILLFSGYWADVYSRKKIAIRSVSLFAICALILLTFSYTQENLNLNSPEYFLYGVAALTGLARALAGPSIQSMLPQLLPRHLYANGIAWNSSVWQLASVSGPALGGLIYGYAGQEYTYLTSAVFVITSLLFFLQLPSFAPSQLIKESIGESLKQGILFVWKNKIVLSALSLDLFAVLFGGAVALLPIFADQVLNTGPQGLGLLRAAPSIGAVVMSLIVTRNTPILHSGKILLISVALFGLTMIGFALSEIFWLSFALLALSGAFDAVSVLIRSSIIQFLTPDEMRGRVASVNGLFIGSSNEIGAFESGLAARLLGLVPSVVFGGCMTILITGIGSFTAPKLRKLHLKDHIEKSG